MVRSPTGAQVRLIPPVVYFGPFGVLWLLQWWRPWTIPGGGAVTGAGLALVLTGITLTLWAVRTFRRAHTTFIPWEQVAAMVTTGPFRFSRNPIYWLTRSPISVPPWSSTAGGRCWCCQQSSW